MKKKKLLVAVGISLTALLVIHLIRKKKSEKRLTVVAEEGYETAEDILFPKRKFRSLL